MVIDATSGDLLAVANYPSFLILTTGPHMNTIRLETKAFLICLSQGQP